MSDMLNAMQQLMTNGTSFFDPEFLEDLADCWDSSHQDLIQANDNAWKGLVEFFDNDGYGTDPWGSCCNDLWSEDNATAQGGDSIVLICSVHVLGCFSVHFIKWPTEVPPRKIILV